MYERDLTREFNLSNYFNINLLLPFLDLEFMKKVMSISNKFKTDGKNKKIILREIALELGLGEEFSERKRTAAQYGSKISSELLKLAKKNGFKNKKDYLDSI